jgi:hypothetical protein
MNLNKLLYTSLITVLFSCGPSFQIPQPVDEENIESLPANYHGVYYPKIGNTSLTKYVIGEDYVEYYDEDEGKFSRESYFFQNNSHYLVMNDEKVEIFYPSFEPDSIYCKYARYNKFQVNKNLVVKKLGEHLILNCTFDNKTWHPVIFENKASTFNVYTINDSILNGMKHSNYDDELIIEDLFVKDFEYYLFRKEKMLHLEAIFDMQNKTFIHPEN